MEQEGTDEAEALFVTSEYAWDGVVGKWVTSILESVRHRRKRVCFLFSCAFGTQIQNLGYPICDLSYLRSLLLKSVDV